MSKISIVGAGVAGSFLYSLLKKNTDHEVKIFDIEKDLGHFCGWGSDYNRINGLLKEVNIDINDFILCRPKKIKILNNNSESLAHGMITINKPLLTKKMLGDNEVIYDTAEGEDSDIIVDATGVKRALLPPIKEDILLKTKQTLQKNKNLDEDFIYIKYGILGYAWAFPLGNNYWHIGVGDLIKEAIFPEEFYEESICSCESNIRFTAPEKSRPFYKEKIIGIGESIGTVDPFTGEGIVPSMESAYLLSKNLDNFKNYEEHILKKFTYINYRADIIDKSLTRYKLNYFLRL